VAFLGPTLSFFFSFLFFLKDFQPEKESKRPEGGRRGERLGEWMMTLLRAQQASRRIRKWVRVLQDVKSGTEFSGRPSLAVLFLDASRATEHWRRACLMDPHLPDVVSGDIELFN